MTWNRNSRSAGPPGTGTDPDSPPPAGVGTTKRVAWTGIHQGKEGAIRVLEPGKLVNQDGVRIQQPASRIEILALDEFVASTAPHLDTLTVETDPEICDIVGMYDQLTIQVVTDCVVNGGATNPLLACDMWHSADGINWVKKQVGTSEIPHFPLSLTSTTTVPMGYDPGTSPSLAFVKLITTITDPKGSGPLSAHVNIRLTCNDAREIQFARKQARQYKRAHKDLPKDYWLPGTARAKKCEKELRVPDDFAGSVEKDCRLKVTVIGGHAYSSHTCTGKAGAAKHQVEAAAKDCLAMGIKKSWVEQQAKAVLAGETAEEPSSRLLPDGPEYNC